MLYQDRYYTCLSDMQGIQLMRQQVCQKDMLSPTLTGWGPSTVQEDLEVWEYLNSYGTGFGRDIGFGELVKEARRGETKRGPYFIYGAGQRYCPGGTEFRFLGSLGF